MKQTIIAAVMILLISANVHAQKYEVYIKKGYAIDGYDAVAYFKDSKAVKGSTTYAYKWHDANWLFASKENLDLFAGAPEKYAPQYDGYCAYGTSEGHKAPTQPDAWTIVNDKLYFNYNTDVKKLWMKDEAGNITKADSNWVNLKDKE